RPPRHLRSSDRQLQQRRRRSDRQLRRRNRTSRSARSSTGSRSVNEAESLPLVVPAGAAQRPRAGIHDRRVCMLRDLWPWVPAFAGTTIQLFVAASEFRVQPGGENRNRAAVGVVRGVDEELIIEGERRRFVDLVGIIGLQNFFFAVIELAVANEQAEAAGREERAVRV